MASQNFDAIYDAVLKSEGGLSTRTAATGDPGGRTMQGITQGTYNTWRAAQGLPSQDVARISPDEHRTITRTEYWDKIRGDDLPTGLDYSVFDTAFNAGPGRAVKLLQRSLGMDEDGRMGPDTVLAAQGANPSTLLGQFTANRRSTYESFRNADQNPGWWPRINDVNATSAAAIRNGGFGGKPISLGYDPNQFFNAGQDTRPGPGDYFDGGQGSIGDSGRPVETGNGTGFSGLDASGGVGPGSLGSGIYANRPVDGFGQGFDASGGTGPGSFHGTFDPSAYLQANPDVAAANVDPLQHYLTYGYKEGRSLDAQGDRINQGFNPSAYLAANPDVAAAGVNPLLHYLQFGAHEGRAADFSGNVGPGSFGSGIYQPASLDTLGLGSVASPAPIGGDFSGAPLSPVATGNPIATPDQIQGDFGSPLSPVPTGPNVSQGVGPGTFHGTFDPSAYLQANPDVASAHVDPLSHYLTYGYNEGRTLDAQGDRINKGFDPTAYLAASPDVAAAHIDPLQHYVEHGASEGRALPTGSNPYTFTGFNAAQGVQPAGFHGQFDPSSYLAANPDVAAANVDPLTHYLTYGFGENRAIDTAGDRINRAFDPTQYLATNTDVAAAHMDPLRHYLTNGASEGRGLPTGANPYSFSNYNVSQGAGPVGPAAFNGRFDPNAYLSANPDVAAAHVDPLQHYLTYGFQEGRAIDGAGDKINQAFDPSAYLNANPDVAAAHADPLQHYLLNGAAEGRSLPTGSNPYSFSNYNVAQGAAPVANASFNGKFDPAAYLAANPDVAASHTDPLQHYLTYGFNEGRAIDAAGDKINRAFDPTQYLAANPDVAAAHADPLRHYLTNGASEGRALPTGSNPYSFSNYNVSQGLGPTGNGAFSLGMGMGQGSPALPQMGGGFNVSGGVPNGSFGLGGITSGGGYGGGSFNPYGFTGANVSGGLGATPQSMGSYYPAGNSQGGGLDPYGFSQANVSGFDVNNLGGGAVEDFGSGAGLGPTQWNDAPSADAGGGGVSGFDHNASELAFLRGQMDQLAARDAALAASHNTNIAFANQGAAQASQLNAVGASNAATQFAGIQAGLGIAPVTGTSFFTPAPAISFGGIGPMLSPLKGFL